ncbi:MAG: hypothetical protein JST22_14030 [Bacteroidetes bacterium]|nr:hypothetical protein [Bacteroidota bacterium]
MNRRAFLTSFFSALAVAMIALAASAVPATAQAPIPNACCTYTVDVAGVPATCLPFKLLTRWTGGTETILVTANGVSLQNITFAPCPPPPAQFGYASLDGGVTKAWFNFPATFNLGTCCYVVRIGVDAAGCIIVYVRGC